MNKKKILLKFDGVVRGSDGEPVPGSIKFIGQCLAQGIEVTIEDDRSFFGPWDIRSWLINQFFDEEFCATYEGKDEMLEYDFLDRVLIAWGAMFRVRIRDNPDPSCYNVVIKELAGFLFAGAWPTPSVVRVEELDRSYIRLVYDFRGAGNGC